MNVIQKIYMVILNPIFAVTGHINEKIRNAVIYLCFVALTGLYLAWHSFIVLGWSVGAGIKALIVSAVLFLVICMSIREKLVKVRWNIFMCICFYGYHIIMLASRYFHPLGEGYMEMLCLSLVLFPCLYFVWNNRGDYEKLFRLISLGVAHVFILYYIILLIGFPVGEYMLQGRYIGTVSNPNMLGQLSIVAAACFLYLIACRSRLYGIYIIMLGAAAFVIMETVSRTALIIFLLELAGFAVWFITDLVRAETDKLRGMITIVALCIVMTAAAVIMPYGMDLATAEAEYESGTQTAVSVNDRIQMDGKDINTVSSGRVVIWKAYLEEINPTGHDGSENLYVAEHGKPQWAHNTILQFTYQSGILAGILYLLLELFVAGYVISGLFTEKKRKDWYLFVLLAAIAYGISSLIEVAIFFFKCMPALLFYISLIPLFEKRPSKSSDEIV